MERLKKLTGRWTGEYSYDPIPNIVIPEPVRFTLELSQGWFGWFNGTVRDDEVRGMPEEGRISGFYAYPRIRFRKMMPKLYIMIPGGHRVSMSEFLAQAGVRSDREYPHPTIFYDGQFKTRDSASGFWEIRSQIVAVNGGRGFKMPACRGSWFIQLSIA